MTDVSDMELVQAYLRQSSEEAFTTLVRRHINLVYSAAFRHVGNAAQAEEITQAVFIILASKAAGLRPDTILEGWLYETTRLTSSSFLRGERRRQWREQEAYMQSSLDESNRVSVWNQISPWLDEAMSRLNKKDRDAVILRFFKEKNLGEVAAALEVTEAAAQRRVLRALEKLRKMFAKRGVTLSAALIAGALSANPVQAAPVGLVKTMSVVALTKGAAAGGSTLTLVEGALKLMAWTKLKTAVVIGAGVLLAAGTATVVVKKAIPSTPAAMEEAIFENPTSLGVHLLESAPPKVLVRPTQFPKALGRGVFWSPTGKAVAVNFPLKTLFGRIYGVNREYVVFAEEMNLGNANYDILVTLPNHQKEALLEELKTQLGLTAHFETRDEDVLLLQIADPAKLQSQQSKSVRYDNYHEDDGQGPVQKHVFKHAGLAIVADYVAVEKPVLDRTGTKEHYDFDFQWTEPKGLSTPAGLSARQNSWAGQFKQVGLELVPTNMPVKMLIVEKVP